MAKTRLTTSEISVKNCFIEVTGKASFKSSHGANDGDEEDNGGNVEVVAKATSPLAKNSVCQTSEVSIPKVGVTREESLEETDNDDKSDYGAESFCSEDSYKGSEVTNVTPRSSMSSCSSLVNSTGLKHDKRIPDLIKNRKSREDDEGGSLSLLENEIKYLSEDEETLMIDRRQLMHSGRRNMSFTNEELRKIERENHLLLKKIMSHQKPQGKGIKANSGPPRTSSSAINRRRQQRKIEEDNMMLLRRIQQAKPCAIPRTSAPSCRLATI